MSIAICPGSFDPVTNGHRNIIERSAELFDRVVVVVMRGTMSRKQPLFSMKERKRMLEVALEDLPNVEVDSFDGLIADYVHHYPGAAIVRGLRAVTDFEREFQMALTNKKLCPEVETLFINADMEYMYLSSAMVREVARYGGRLEGLVHPELEDYISWQLFPEARRISETVSEMKQSVL